MGFLDPIQGLPKPPQHTGDICVFGSIVYVNLSFIDNYRHRKMQAKTAINS